MKEVLWAGACAHTGDGRVRLALHLPDALLREAGRHVVVHLRGDRVACRSDRRQRRVACKSAGWVGSAGLGWQRRLSWQGTRRCEEEKAFQCAVAEWLFVSRHSLLQNGCFTKRQNTGCCRLLPERVVLPFRWGRKCDLPTASVPLIKYDQSRRPLRREKAKVELRPTARLNPHPWA